VKNLETQATIMPPEAPEEGLNSKLSNLLGETFFHKMNINKISFGFLKNRKYSPHSLQFCFSASSICSYHLDLKHSSIRYSKIYSLLGNKGRRKQKARGQSLQDVQKIENIK
jgi:hypothetical protein